MLSTFLIEPDFLPWEPNDPIFSTAQPPQILGLDALNSGSDEPNRDKPGSDEPSLMDEKKRRRMQSNRESARRSRMKKQRHLENLGKQVSRFKERNRELANRLRLVLQNTQLIQSENEFLRSEAVVLRRRLIEMRQLQQELNPTSCTCSYNDGQLMHNHSLIALNY